MSNFNMKGANARGGQFFSSQQQSAFYESIFKKSFEFNHSCSTGLVGVTVSDFHKKLYTKITYNIHKPPVNMKEEVFLKLLKIAPHIVKAFQEGHETFAMDGVVRRESVVTLDRDGNIVHESTGQVEGDHSSSINEILTLFSNNTNNTEKKKSKRNDNNSEEKPKKRKKKEKQSKENEEEDHFVQGQEPISILEGHYYDNDKEEEEEKDSQS